MGLVNAGEKRKKALLEEKRHCWEKNGLCSQQPNSSRKPITNPPKNSPTKASQPHQGGGLGGWDNVPTLAVFFV